MDDQIPKEVSLEHLFPPERLSEQLRGFHEWQPFPKPTQRAFWDHLPADVQQELLAAGIETRNAPWPALPAGLYLNYVRFGDRSKFESAFFQRREILTKMVLAECSQYQGYFLDSIADAVWGICEESTWCVPAHVSVQLQGEGLPDTGEPIVDLFAAETGALLAWVLFLLEDELESISPMVPMRIEREIQQRILIPAATRDDFWWMGFSDRKVNNWNPWINSNWLACVLLVEKIPETRSRTVSKILHSLDQFFIPYPQDGGCDEGPSYWGRAGASLFDCLNLLDSALVGGAAEVFELPKVKEIGRFIYRSHIAGEYYLNFADAPAVLQPDPATVYGYGKRINDPVMVAFGAWQARNQGLQQPILGKRNLQGALFTLLHLEEMVSAPKQEPLLRDVWLKDIQVVTGRDQAGSASGFYFAAKGGHNDESHNHNDVGNFIIYLDGKPLIVDAGVETYTRKTFSPQRYEIWTMQSAYHCLPTINGAMQAVGRAYAANEVFYQADEQKVRFSLDIAAAYPSKAHLVRWLRRITLKRSGWIEIYDSWECTRSPESLVFSLLTPSRIDLTIPGVIDLQSNRLPERPGEMEARWSAAGKIHYDASLFKTSCEVIPIRDNRLRPIWGDQLFRLIFNCQQLTQKGNWKLKILRS